MKLFTDIAEDIKVIVEAKEDGGPKKYYIQGPFMMGEEVNRNKRKYPIDILESAVNKYKAEYIDRNRAFGELGHPSGPTINLDRVSHRIVSLVKEGNNFIGKALILDTPLGNIAKNILESGSTLGVSSRGMGSLELTREGYSVVKDDFYLATAADIVADPSAPNAFVNGIMEGVEWLWNERGQLVAMESKEEIEAAVRSRELTLERKLRIFEQYLNKLSKNA